MTINTTTTTDYKYHIYEFVDGGWQRVPFFYVWDKVKVVAELERVQTKFPVRIFKLVTEKITTVHEFMEEGEVPLSEQQPSPGPIQR